MNFITGEKIQCICDHFIGVDFNFKYNPNIYKLKDRHLDVTQINKPFNNKRLLFCYNTSKFTLELLIQKLKYMQNPFKLIFHNSDKLFYSKHLALFEELPLLQHIYAQNTNCTHEKVSPLPIGMANSQWEHGNQDIHQEIYDKSIKKSKNIYFNFNYKTSKTKRKTCFNKISKKGVKWIENLPYREYLIELKKHKYGICPEGGGLDTHRFWECLYMNTMPICLRNPLTEHYEQYFPMVLLDSWGDLDINQLSYSPITNHHRLDMNDIVKQILS